MIRGKTDIELYSVSYSDVTNQWLSPPVYFSGDQRSYGRFIDVADVAISGSFGWIASVYMDDPIHDGPLIEWDNGTEFRTHIWVLENTLYVSYRQHGCPHQQKYDTSSVNANQWYIMAVSYEAKTHVISIWVDGQLEQEVYPACEGGSPESPTNAWVSKR